MKSMMLVFFVSLFLSSNCWANIKGYIINNVHIIDGTGSQAKLGSVIIEGEQIKQIAWTQSALPDTANYITIDGSNKVLTPGFIDLHAHGNRLLMVNLVILLRWG